MQSLINNLGLSTLTVHADIWHQTEEGPNHLIECRSSMVKANLIIVNDLFKYQLSRVNKCSGEQTSKRRKSS
jgi:hypothetical protein